VHGAESLGVIGCGDADLRDGAVSHLLVYSPLP
jgi:hypothetical protein